MPDLICIVPVCPVRAEPSHRSEQVSQLLFGEAAELVEESGDFTKVKCLYDQYEGWCQTVQLEHINAVGFQFSANNLMANWINEVVINNYRMMVPFASVVPMAKQAIGCGEINIQFTGKCINSTKLDFDEKTITQLAYTFINSPYQWGGRSVFGIDCSGLTQVVFKFLNIPLQRDASQQALQGEGIGFLMEAKCGDLAFFDNEAGKITHVGILLNTNTIIHASGKVRVDSIDNFGIVSSDTGKRTHNLRVIKRMVQ